MLNIALPKGRLGDQVYELLASVGYDCKSIYDENRKLVFENPQTGVRYLLVKPSDVAIYVEHHAADVGIVGKDILMESNPDVYELLDLGLGKCRMCVAGKEDYVEDKDRPVRVATKFTNIAKEHYAKLGRDIDIIKLNGSIELALLRAYGDDVKVRARAKAAAGSDARMNGCSMPVVINSGSGNQGMTCSLPVIEYARELKVSKEKMYRALVVSNLIAIHQKTYIGSLSAYCGAVSAACGAGAAISWLNGGDYNAISKTITNALANTSGIVCDGAKSSCAAKIASAVDAAIMAYALEDADHCFQAGEGLVRDNVEDTIRNMGYVGRVGMKDTDVTILNLMIDQKKV